MKDKQPLEMTTMTTKVAMRRVKVAAAEAGAEEGEDLGAAVGSGVAEEALEEDSGVISVEDSEEVAGEARMEAEMEVMMGHLEEVSEAAVKVAGEAEDSEEVRAEAAVEKAGAGEVTAAPLKAKAKLKVLPAASKTTIVHLSLSITFLPKKIVTPPVLVAGHHHHHSSVFEQKFELICLFKISNTRLVTKTASWRQFHVCV